MISEINIGAVINLANQMLGITALVFALMSIPFIVFAMKSKRKDSVYKYFILLCISNVCWMLMQASFYLLPDASSAVFFWNLRLVFVFTTCVFAYFVILSSVKRLDIKSSPEMFLFVFPFVTLIFVLLDQFLGTTLINMNANVISKNGARALELKYSLWFILHSAFCYIIVVIAACTVISHYRKMPARYRTPIIILFSSVTIAPIGSALAIAKVLPFDLDLAPYISILGQILCYFALANPHSVGTLASPRDVIFENADHAMFIVNHDNEIIDFNLAAGKITKIIEKDLLKQTSFERWLDAWLSHFNGECVDENQQIFTIHEENGDSHFQVVRSLLYSSKKQIGAYLELKNITPIMTMIHILQDSAYFDGLTGLPNRNYMIQKMELWDKEDALPLGIAVADLNDLKRVNDSHGHIEGDILLQAAAKALTSQLPAGAVAARMGGDEFICFVPNATSEIMESYIHSVETMCEELSKDKTTKLSIAMAYALRTTMGTSITEAIKKADIDMYATKNNRRKNSSYSESM